MCRCADDKILMLDGDTLPKMLGRVLKYDVRQPPEQHTPRKFDTMSVVLQCGCI